MTALLDHLGVALLGHIESGKTQIPTELHPAWELYARNKFLAPDLLSNKKLLSFLMSSELRIPDDFLGAATLAALGYIFGHVSLADAKETLCSSAKLDQLLCRLRSRIRITRGARRY